MEDEESKNNSARKKISGFVRVGFYTSISFAFGCTLSMLYPLVSLTLYTMDVSQSQMGYIFSMTPLLMFITANPVAYLSGRYGAKNILLLGLFFLMIFHAFTGFLEVVYLFYFTLGALGIASSAIRSTLLEIISLEFDEDAMFILGYNEFILGSGSVLDPFLATLIYEETGQLYLPYLVILSLVALQAILLVPLSRTRTPQDEEVGDQVTSYGIRDVRVSIPSSNYSSIYTSIYTSMHASLNTPIYSAMRSAIHPTSDVRNQRQIISRMHSSIGSFNFIATTMSKLESVEEMESFEAAKHYIPKDTLQGIKEEPDVLSSFKKKKRSRYRDVLANSEIQIGLLSVFVCSLAWNAASAVLTIKVLQFDVPTYAIGVAFASQSATFAISSPLATWVGEKVDKITLILIGNLVYGAGTFLMGHNVLEFYGSGNTVFYVIVVLLAVCGVANAFGYTVAGPLLMTLIATNPSFEGMGCFASGLFVFSQSLGWFSGSIIGSVLTDIFSFEVAMTYVSYVIFLSVLPAIYYKIKRRGRAVEKRETSPTAFTFDLVHATMCIGTKIPERPTGTPSAKTTEANPQAPKAHVPETPIEPPQQPQPKPPTEPASEITSLLSTDHCRIGDVIS